jgi:hypothetical protein
MRNTWLLIGAMALGAVSLAASCDDETAVAAHVSCPNDLPAHGTPCPEAGLVCNYFTGCVTYYPATCQPDLTWKTDDACMGAGGTGASGGTAGSGGTGGSAGAAPGGGGQGGSGAQGGGGSSNGGSGNQGGAGATGGGGTGGA